MEIDQPESRCAYLLSVFLPAPISGASCSRLESEKMDQGMTKAQRVVLLIGAICILHSSMVPPVSQAESSTCRYHEFVERQLPFTRGYGVVDSDVVALLTEYGMILSVGAIVFLALGLIRKS